MSDGSERGGRCPKATGRGRRLPGRRSPRCGPRKPGAGDAACGWPARQPQPW
jgi:hypothetical protein